MATDPRCPVCRGPIEGIAELRLFNGILVSNRGAVNLGFMEVPTIMELMEGPRTMDQLLNATYPRGRRPSEPGVTMRVRLHKLRDKLKSLGFEIANARIGGDLGGPGNLATYVLRRRP